VEDRVLDPKRRRLEGFGTQASGNRICINDGQQSSGPRSSGQGGGGGRERGRPGLELPNAVQRGGGGRPETGTLGGLQGGNGMQEAGGLGLEPPQAFQGGSGLLRGEDHSGGHAGSGGMRGGMMGVNLPHQGHMGSGMFRGEGQGLEPPPIGQPGRVWNSDPSWERSSGVGRSSSELAAPPYPDFRQNIDRQEVAEQGVAERGVFEQHAFGQGRDASSAHYPAASSSSNMGAKAPDRPTTSAPGRQGQPSGQHAGDQDTVHRQAPKV
jgi:hypothetical protein